MVKFEFPQYANHSIPVARVLIACSTCSYVIRMGEHYYRSAYGWRHGVIRRRTSWSISRLCSECALGHRETDQDKLAALESKWLSEWKGAVV